MRIGSPALIGVISDTHGTLDGRVAGILDGVDAIVHAGDIGSPAVLMELELIAPVLAVRGNTDEADWAHDLPLRATLEVGEHLVAVEHDSSRPPSQRVDVLVAGHTHRPLIEHRDGYLRVNPGSASTPRGHGARPTVARLAVGADGITARIFDL